jgi:SHS2 domain-containing protein
MPKMYMFTNHTADIEFVAYGKATAELFKNSLLAMFEAIADTKKLQGDGRPTRQFSVAAKSYTEVEALWLLLQGALSKADAMGCFCYSARVMPIKKEKGKCSVNAICYAKKKTPESANFDVKGVSLFDMKIRKGKRLSASVVLDV